MSMRRRNQYVIRGNAGPLRSQRFRLLQNLARQHAAIDNNNRNLCPAITEHKRPGEQRINIAIRSPLLEHPVHNDRILRRRNIHRKRANPQPPFRHGRSRQHGIHLANADAEHKQQSGATGSASALQEPPPKPPRAQRLHQLAALAVCPLNPEPSTLPPPPTSSPPSKNPTPVPSQQPP